MLEYCLKRKPDTESKNRKLSKTSNVSIIIPSKCAMCNSKKLKLIRNPEATGYRDN